MVENKIIMAIKSTFKTDSSFFESLSIPEQIEI